MKVNIKVYSILITTTRKEKKCWFKDINVSRSWGTLVNRLRANHYNLNVSLARKDISSPDCECGLGIEDVDHVVWECTNLSHQRAEMMKRMKGTKIKNTNQELIVKIIQREDWQKIIPERSLKDATGLFWVIRESDTSS